MAICVYHAPQSMTEETYQSVLDKLEAAGQGKPDGRAYHAAFWAGPNLHVFDVWETREKFDAFGAILMPILSEAGAGDTNPQVSEVFNTITG